LRDVPIITFVNKLDREGRDPFDLLDEIEQSLALDVTPASWPIGMGRDFLGTYDLFADALLLFERGVHDRVVAPVHCKGLDDPKLARLLPKAALAKLREEVEIDPQHRDRIAFVRIAFGGFQRGMKLKNIRTGRKKMRFRQ
jgi:peptide chain release factor 3